MKYLLLTLLFFTAQLAIGQGVKDMLKLYKKEAELTIGFNNRRTHIHNEFGVIYGFKIGLNFDRRLKNTFGLNSTIIPLGQPTYQGAFSRASRLHFISITEEYIYFKKNRLNLSTYASFGYGINQYELFNGVGEVIGSGHRSILPVEFGLQSSYFIFTWLEARLGGGWRFILFPNQDDLSGYFFKAGLGFKLKAFKKAFGLIE